MNDQVVFIIEDDVEMAFCERLAVKEAGVQEVYCFDNAIAAASATSEIVPELIILDILLVGPNGFTLLNELASYSDTARVPIIVVSSLKFSEQDLAAYGVIKVFDKATMKPQDLSDCVAGVLNYAG